MWILKLLTDLALWTFRRPLDHHPLQTAIPHSKDLRTLIWAVAGTDLLTGLMVDRMISGAFWIIHLCWMFLSFVLTIGVAVMTLRAPHLLGEEFLHLRTGPLGRLKVPLRQIAGARTLHSVKKGFGLREVRQEDSSVACSNSGTTNIVIELKDPLEVRLRRGRAVAANRVFFCADDPRKAASVINQAIKDAP